jgi:hypothetical protein
VIQDIFGCSTLRKIVCIKFITYIACPLNEAIFRFREYHRATVLPVVLLSHITVGMSRCDVLCCTVYIDHVDRQRLGKKQVNVMRLLLLAMTLICNATAIVIQRNTTSKRAIHRINCGSTKQVVVPPNNVVWAPDQYSTPGEMYDTCGTNTTSIYCTNRYFRTIDGAPHQYNLPVPTNNRAYTVRLHFAEQVRLGVRGSYSLDCHVLFS